jgi:hypothetical protein
MTSYSTGLSVDPRTRAPSRRAKASFADVQAVTPDNTNYLNGLGASGAAIPCDAIIVGASGNVKLDTANDTAVTVYMVAGYIYPIQATRIYSTGTAATGIVACWY